MYITLIQYISIEALHIHMMIEFINRVLEAIVSLLNHRGHVHDGFSKGVWILPGQVRGVCFGGISIRSIAVRGVAWLIYRKCRKLWCAFSLYLLAL